MFSHLEKCQFILRFSNAAHSPRIYQLLQERFQREAAILEKLGEENSQIPRLYAYFSFAGYFYLVQQWIDGQTLTQKVQQQVKLSESFVTELLKSLLLVLDYVHSKRIIHRDKFGDRVGWRVNQTWIDYEKVTFDTKAPVGHLPVEIVTTFRYWDSKVSSLDPGL
ncbi:MAG: GUN4 domain-containing protein [Stigonema ocellatum SAG 48.90 = DSM 106950]|nr:GUN4 domain-containing protein [Stigonema ocellatum SAG 48.90 = DSM 106950]